MAKKTKAQKDTISYLKLKKRSGEYIPNSTGSGMTKAPKDVQRQFRKDVKAKIKSVRKGL